MDKQTQRMTWMKNGAKILMWIALLIFFVYSFQAIMDVEEIGSPHRQQSVVRVFKALSQPNFFDYEYETRETPLKLENDCQSSEEVSQVVRVSQRRMTLHLKCTPGQGATFTINGSGFQPSIAGYVVMQSNIPGNESWKFTASDFSTDREGGFSITVRVIPMDLENIIQGSTIAVIEQLSKTRLGFSNTSQVTAEKMWETIQIAFLATVIGTILGIPLTLLSAQASSGWGRGFNLLLQPIFAVIRSIHPLITVIPAIITVGIGPTAGVLALALFSTAVLIDKFSEYAWEHTSMSRPAMLAIYFPGIAFRHFPTNLAIATVLGFVGGGGIGFLLQQNINLLAYRDASVSLFAIIITIGSLDLLSRAVWHRIQKNPPAEPIAPEKVEKNAQI